MYRVKRECTIKIAPKRNVFGIWGRPVSYVFGKLFSGTSQIVCVYVEPFKSNMASNVTILTKSPQKLSLLELLRIPGGGGYHHAPYVFRKLFSRAILRLDSTPLS